MFIVSQQRKKYTPEYRHEAANLVIESERPIAHVAKEIGVAPGLLGRWIKNERERRGSSDGLSEADLRAETARLHRELAEARMNNQFLSKATAFFAAKQREQKDSTKCSQSKANYSIKLKASLLKVSRSGYYKWAHTQQKRLSGEDDRAAFYNDVDRQIHQIWSDSDEVYGAPQNLPSATALCLTVRLWLSGWALKGFHRGPLFQ